jgi:hypothetical protein
MSRIVVVILINHNHKPIDLILTGLGTCLHWMACHCKITANVKVEMSNLYI